MLRCTPYAKGRGKQFAPGRAGVSWPKTTELFFPQKLSERSSTRCPGQPTQPRPCRSSRFTAVCTSQESEELHDVEWHIEGLVAMRQVVPLVFVRNRGKKGYGDVTGCSIKNILSVGCLAMRAACELSYTMGCNINVTYVLNSEVCTGSVEQHKQPEATKPVCNVTKPAMRGRWMMNIKPKRGSRPMMTCKRNKIEIKDVDATLPRAFIAHRCP